MYVLLLSFNKCYQIVSVLEKLISDNSSMPALYRIFVHEHINSSFLQPGSVLGYRIYPVINISLDRFLLFIELLWYNVHAHWGFGKEKRVCKIFKINFILCIWELLQKNIQNRMETLFLRWNFLINFDNYFFFNI